MHLTLTIEADSVEELAPFFQQKSSLAQYVERQRGRDTVKEVEPERGEPDAEPEVAEEAPAPKQRRGRKAAADATSPPTTTASELASTPPTEKPATTEATVSSDVTLDDIRKKASEILDGGKVSGKEVQDLLVNKFDARAFGQLKPEQYADVIGELESL